jgi:hypothetical protein
MADRVIVQRTVTLTLDVVDDDTGDVDEMLRTLDGQRGELLICGFGFDCTMTLPKEAT